MTKNRRRKDRDALSPRWIVGLAAVGLLFVGTYALGLDPAATSSEVQGIVTGHQKRQSRYRSNPARLMVKIDRGRTVRASALGALQVPVGTPVTLREDRTRVFRQRRYALLRLRETE